MCKFNSRLFVFLIVVSLLIVTITARPSSSRSLIDLLTDGNDYDLRYDQRQKGVENVRIKLDGIFIGIPAEPTSLFLMTDELVNVLGEELILGRHGENQGQLSDIKNSPGQTIASELQNYQGTEQEKTEVKVQSEKVIPEGRGDLNQGSRTKVYVMNLLDYIIRNRHT